MKRILIFSHYNRKKLLSSYVVYLLEQFRLLFERVVFVSNSELDEESKKKLLPFTDKILERENSGYDFAAWKEALIEESWAKINDYDSLTLINDSCFGPLNDLAHVYYQMERLGYDFWGITNRKSSVELIRGKQVNVPEHIQSYFICFNKNVVCTTGFQSFWEQVINLEDIKDVIINYEIKLTSFLTDLGFTFSVFIDTTAYNQQHLNLAACHPDVLIPKGLPFLKVKAVLLFKNKKNLKDIILKNSKYPLDLIDTHIINMDSEIIDNGYENRKPTSQKTNGIYGHIVKRAISLFFLLLSNFKMIIRNSIAAIKKIPLLRTGFYKTELSVGWILCGNHNVGSSRIHGINIHKGLKDAGIQSYLLQTPNGYVEKLAIGRIEQYIIKYSRIDVVVFQRVYDLHAIEFCRSLRRKGTICGFFMADIYRCEMIKEVDFILVASKYLEDILENDGVSAEKICVINDAIETPPSLRKTYESNESNKNEKIKIIWVGAEGHWHTLKTIRRILETNNRLSNFELITISNHPEADINWRLDTVWDEILACDIGIIPADTTRPELLSKSNNRATMFMALAMPVICSPLPSYLEAIKHRENGFIANSEDDWASYLIELGDFNVRSKIGNVAYTWAHEQYSREKITKDFLSMINKVRNA